MQDGGPLVKRRFAFVCTSWVALNACAPHFPENWEQFRCLKAGIGKCRVTHIAFANGPMVHFGYMIDGSYDGVGLHITEISFTHDMPTVADHVWLYWRIYDERDLRHPLAERRGIETQVTNAAADREQTEHVDWTIKPVLVM